MKTMQQHIDFLNGFYIRTTKQRVHGVNGFLAIMGYVMRVDGNFHTGTPTKSRKKAAHFATRDEADAIVADLVAQGRYLARELEVVSVRDAILLEAHAKNVSTAFAKGEREKV